MPELLLALALFGSPAIIDSLQAVLRGSDLPDLQRVLTLFALGEEHHSHDAAAAGGVAWQALAVAHRSHFVRGELMVFSDHSYIAVNQVDLTQAERWTQELQHRLAHRPAAMQHFRNGVLKICANVTMAQGIGYSLARLPVPPANLFSARSPLRG